MGIRYYAYAFDAVHARQAIEDPRSILSSDPLADAWGLEPHATVSFTTFEQVPPKRDMLYLDKAWAALQDLTLPDSKTDAAASCHRIFEGNVTMTGFGWEPFIRTILPTEMPAIHSDLALFDEFRVRAWADGWRSPHGANRDDELRYVLDYLEKAQQFVEALTADGRGMVYMIG